jgi:hypothetical protein
MIDYDYDDVTILNRFEIYISFFLKLNYFNIESELWILCLKYNQMTCEKMENHSECFKF